MAIINTEMICIHVIDLSTTIVMSRKMRKSLNMLLPIVWPTNDCAVCVFLHINLPADRCMQITGSKVAVSITLFTWLTNVYHVCALTA